MTDTTRPPVPDYFRPHGRRELPRGPADARDQSPREPWDVPSRDRAMRSPREASPPAELVRGATHRVVRVRVLEEVEVVAPSGQVLDRFAREVAKSPRGARLTLEATERRDYADVQARALGASAGNVRAYRGSGELRVSVLWANDPRAAVELEPETPGAQPRRVFVGEDGSLELEPKRGA